MGAGSLMFGQTPSSMGAPAPRCGLCKAAKERRTYNAHLKNAVRIQEVFLCIRCDLTPDPPVRPA